jgi:hypothetical protein
LKARRWGALPEVRYLPQDRLQAFARYKDCCVQGLTDPELYQPSRRPYCGLGRVEYPFHDRTVVVTHCGRICFGRRKIHLSHVSAGLPVGIREVAEKIWLVTFMHYDLGFFDHQTGRVECAETPLSNPRASGRPGITEVAGSWTPVCPPPSRAGRQTRAGPAPDARMLVAS